MKKNLNKHEPMIKHLYHDMKITRGPYGPHLYKMTCKSCNKFIKWATDKEVIAYEEITNEQV